MKITGTHFNYYQVCKRKLWLFANGIRFEHTSDLVFEGKLIHEDSYPQRSSKYEEIELDGIKVDSYEEVFLSDIDRQAIAEMKLDISKIVMDEKCPPLQRKSICKSCSYYEFCYSREVEE